MNRRRNQKNIQNQADKLCSPKGRKLEPVLAGFEGISDISE